MINVLVFDSLDKYNLLKSWTKGCKILHLTYSFNVELALKMIYSGFREWDIILFGGNAGSEDFKSVELAGRLKAAKYKFPVSYITSWDTEEIAILENLLPKKSKNCPFSEKFANMLVSKARNMNAYKKRKGKD